ncbi:hypothetical protein KSP40_PGU006150 [Platanthera guangdongensis]|uniref:Uncharacterized protein n=1 Tax=Platanthera guangdongensis TaxID=2320717 RepID=A0ABR2MBH2_9ASPA
MGIVKKKHLEPSWSVAGDKGFAGEPKSPGFTADFEDRKRKSEGSDGFISIDIASLSLIVAFSASSPSAAGEEDRIDRSATVRGRSFGRSPPVKKERVF